MKTPTTATTTKAPASSSSSSSSSSGNFLLGGVQRIRAPTSQDVLCGRGGAVNHHRGNILFRQYCAARKHDYYSAKNNKEKLVIALEVVQLVRAGGDGTSSTGTNPSPPRGRFLTKDASSSVLGAHGGHWWIEVEETKAIAKTSQALREGASKIRSEEHTSITTNSNSHSNNTLKSGRVVGNENTSVLLKKRKRGTMTAVSPFPKTVSIESLALSSAAARTSTTTSSFLNSTFEDYNVNTDNVSMMDELYNNVEQARLMDDEIVVDRGIFDEEAHDLAELALDHEENYNNNTKKHKSDHPHSPVLQQQLQQQYSIVTTTDTNTKNSSNFVVAPLISNKKFATKYRTSSSTTSSSDKNKINMIVTPPLVAVNAAAPAHDYINAIPTLCLDTTTTATTENVPPTATVTLKQQEPQQLSRRPSVATLHTLLHVDMTTLMGNEGYDFVNPFLDEWIKNMQQE